MLLLPYLAMYVWTRVPYVTVTWMILAGAGNISKVIMKSGMFILVYCLMVTTDVPSPLST